MPTPPPVERFAAIFRMLLPAISAMRGGRVLSDMLVGLLERRLVGIRIRIAELLAHIQAGTYQPRAPAKPRAAEETIPTRPAPPEHPLPHKFGWLLPIVPYQAAANAHQMLHRLLFEDADIQALLATAPTALRRPLRSLCWMVGLKPPQILANPKRPRKFKPEPRAQKAPRPRGERKRPSRSDGRVRAEAADAPRPDPPDLPPVLRDMPSSAHWPNGIPFRPLKKFRG